MSIFAPKRHLCSNIGILALFDNFGLRISQKPKQIEKIYQHTTESSQNNQSILHQKGIYVQILEL